MIRLPKTKRGMTAYIFAIAMLTFSLFATANSKTPKSVANAPSQTTDTTAVLGEKAGNAYVLRIVDGDTFEIEGGIKVRLIGIDAPESVDPKKPVECYAKEASARLSELLLNQTVTLTRDISDKDSFGRLLRYAYVGNTFVNKTLVEGGFAIAKSYAPDTTHQEELRAAQRAASFNHLGVWSTACGNK